MSGLRSLARWLAGLVVLLLILCAAAPAVAGAASPPAHVPHAPVILIHGLLDAPAAWGVPRDAGGGGSGFYRLLLGQGYRPGRDLFWLDYRDEAGGDYVELARTRLAPLVQQVLQRSGAARVDLVAHGMGALIARYYIERLGGAASVRTLVMLAPPNRGAFTANLLRRLGAVQLDRPADLAEEVDWDLNGQAFTTAHDYVAALAGGYFGPLLRDFLLAERLGPALSAPVSPTSFARWFETTYPGEYRESFPAAQAPPSGARGAEAGLSRAYYHYLALETAREAQLLQAPVAVTWQPDLTSFRLADWQGWLAREIGRWLLSWGLEKGERLARDLGRRASLTALREWQGVDPRAAAVSRLVTEYATLAPAELEPSTWRANAFLAAWNERAPAGWRARPVKYAVIMPQMVNLWSLFLPQVQANDGLAEARSAFLPPGPLDEFSLPRALWLTHQNALGQAAVQRALWRALQPLPGDAPRLAPAPERGQEPVQGHGYLGLAEPSFWALDLPAGPGTLAWEVELPPDYRDGRSSSSGFAVRGDAWLHRPGDSPEHLGTLAWQGSTGRLALRRPGSLPGEGQVYLSLRAQPRAGAPRPEQLTGRPVLYSFTLRWLSEPAATPGSSGAAGAPAGPEPAPPTPARPPGSSPEQPGAGRLPAGGESGATAPEGEAGAAAPGAEAGEGGRTGSDDEPAEGAQVPPGTPAGGAEGWLLSSPGFPVRLEDLHPGQVPLIEVVLHSRLTTDKKERRVYHQRWEWDFGDGARSVDDDPGHTAVTVRHAFAQPGRYEVRAVSRANDGRVLRDLRWDVPVGEGESGEDRAFHAETIVEPIPEIEIDGPVKWIVGRPARFRVRVRIPDVPHVRGITVRLYPAPVFAVQWRRPGTFSVRAAVLLRINYEFPERRLTLYNTYVAERAVEVLATTVGPPGELR